MNRRIVAMFISACLVSIASGARGEVSQRDVGSICLKSIGEEAETVRLDKVVKIRSNGSNKELLLLRGAYSSYNGTVLVFLRDSNKCDLVLSTEARRVEFKFAKGKSFPDIEMYSTQGNDDNGIMVTEEELYTWDGNKYVQRMR